jgi:hypothetical protein
MNEAMRTLAFVLCVLSLSNSTSAQWLDQPTVGIPRLPDGKPNLTAPAPRASDSRTDLSGLWLLPLPPGYVANIASDLQPGDVRPAAAATFAQRMAEFGKDDPGTIGCQPLGPRYITGGGLVARVKIIQTPAIIVLLYEDLVYRQIFLDGRQLPPDPNPSFMGYSVGRWEGDTLVVESTGFNDRTWLDFGGHPHTESLKTTERFRRTDFGHMQRQVTLDDPGVFAKPIAIATAMTLSADTELLEYVCAENPKDRAHLVGRTTEERAINVPAATLARYVGVYETEGDANFGIRRFEVSLSAGVLLLDLNGKGRLPLTPLSETMFSPRLLGTYEFVVDREGRVTHLLAHSAEEVVKAVKSAGPR